MALRTDGPSSGRSVQSQQPPDSGGSTQVTGRLGAHQLTRTQPHGPPPQPSSSSAPTPPAPFLLPDLPRTPGARLVPTSPRMGIPSSTGSSSSASAGGVAMGSARLATTSPVTSTTASSVRQATPPPPPPPPSISGAHGGDLFGDEDLFRFGSDDDEELGFGDEADFRFGSPDDGQDVDDASRGPQRSDPSSNRSDRADLPPRPPGLRRQERFGKPSPQLPLPSSSSGSQTSSTTTTATVRPTAQLVKLAASPMAVEAMRAPPRTSSQLIHGEELLRDLGVGRRGLTQAGLETPLSAYLKNLHEPIRPKQFHGQLQRLDERLQKAGTQIDKAIAASRANRPEPTPDERAEARTAWVSAKRQGAIEDYLPMSAREKALTALKDQVAADRQLLADIAKGPPPAADSGLTLSHFIEMRRLGFPDDASKDMAVFNRAQETRREPLGSGLVNVTDRVAYKGVAGEQVYKGAEPSISDAVEVVGAIGIDYGKPLLANRNIASVAMDRQLGLSLLPDTHYASNGNEVGVVMTLAQGTQPGKTCLLPLTKAEAATVQAWQDDLEQGAKGPDEFRERMEGKGFAIGKDGVWCRKSIAAATMDTTDPKLLQLLSNLEWLDKLTGQVDRHLNNYLIEFDDKGNVVGLVGIDNDFAFGKDNLDPATRVKTGEPERLGHQIRGLPLLVDSDTAKSIEDMAADWHKPGGMKAQLAKLLPPAEIAAAESRLFATKAKDGFTGLLEHVQQLRGDKRVVPQDQWATWRDPQTGKSAHDVLAADLSGPQGQKWPQAEKAKSYLAMLEAEAGEARQLAAERI